MGVKIALSLISSYASGGIDRNGQEISPMQVRLSHDFRKSQCKVEMLLCNYNFVTVKKVDEVQIPVQNY